ncbi:MAG TPA: class I SAM-dependent methyltransferase [Burkholderiales bacterium]|nr:class I SAM-dependent methyltransferase [Burkholderiales bacterium]
MNSKYDQKVAGFWDRESRDWGDKYGRKTSYFYRRRTFHDFFQSSGLKNASILDYGCGAGDISFPMLRDGHTVLGVDIAPEMVKKAQSRAAEFDLSARASYFHINDDVLQMISARQFDVVICSSVLEYVPDDMALVRMFQSVLKDGGILLTSIPDKRSLFCKLDKWMYANQELMPRFVPVRKLAYLEIQKRQYDVAAFVRTLEKMGLRLQGKKYSTIKLQRGLAMEKVSNLPGMGMLAILKFQKTT